MGFFGFRRSIKLLPGLRVNLSKTGVGTSLGRPGATINIRGDRVRTTVGMPGTGMSYTEQSRKGGSALAVILLIALVIGALLLFA